MINPYLSNMMNNHKAYGKLKVHSGNKIIAYETSGEQKIQLTVSINFVSSNDNFDENRNMHRKSDNVDISMGICLHIFLTDETTEEHFESLLQNLLKYLEK